MTIQDNILYYLPTWSQNSGPSFRSGSLLSQEIQVPERRVIVHANHLVDKGLLMRKLKGCEVFYAHPGPREAT